MMILKNTLWLAFALPLVGQSAPAEPSASVPAGSAPAPAGVDAAGLMIQLPADEDEYARLVRTAQSGDASVNYQALRYAYIGSKAYFRAARASAEIRKTREELRAAVKARDNQLVRMKAVQLLGHIYIDMEGHKYLYQACKYLLDSPCESLHRSIEMGLLTSVLKSGDAGSCDTGWEVVSLDEEYFILRMRGAELKSQHLVQGEHGICDEMKVVVDDNVERSYYFKVNRVFAGYKLRETSGSAPSTTAPSDAPSSK